MAESNADGTGRSAGPVHADRLPTLTEVVELGAACPAPQAESAFGPWQPAPLVFDSAWLVQQVLSEIAPHLDEHFERRLRAALAPAVARAVGGLLAEGRAALAAPLRELVEEAVARAMSRAGTQTCARAATQALDPDGVNSSGGLM